MNKHTFTIEPNPGYDSEYPTGDYPVVMWIRSIVNPLNSQWLFCKSRAEAEREMDIARTIMEWCPPTALAPLKEQL